jgi:hypothetical protein
MLYLLAERLLRKSRLPSRRREEPEDHRFNRVETRPRSGLPLFHTAGMVGLLDAVRRLND